MYDVVIVGGGVAGCYLASLLPETCTILLLEKDKKVRPKDSGIVSSAFADHLPLGNLTKTGICRMRCVSPSGKEFVLAKDEPFAYILRRERLTRFLRSRVTVSYETFVSAAVDYDGVTVVTEHGKYRCKLLVGADGAGSRVRHAMNINAPRLSTGLMVKTNARMRDDITVFFNKFYSPDFFSWIIPQNQEYGLITAVRPKACLDFFSRREHLPGGTLYAYRVPSGVTKSYAERCLLVGDACGQTKPLTGGGIVYALTACTSAATVVADAIEKDRFDASFLGVYERLWKRDLMWEIRKQLMLRNMYRRLSNQDIDKLFDTFGQSVASVKNFDYDMLTLSVPALPKIAALRFFVANIRHAFS